MVTRQFQFIFFIGFFSICLTATGIAQDSSSTNTVVDSSGTETLVSVHMERELERYLGLMDSLDLQRLKTYGYRIQIFSSSGPSAKKDALKSQSDFLKLYRDHPSYTSWDYPNWVVRLGDYRTHLRAHEFHDEIKELYPASFIVKDEIKVN